MTKKSKSRHSPLAKDTISGIIEQAGKLAELPFPFHNSYVAS